MVKFVHKFNISSWRPQSSKRIASGKAPGSLIFTGEKKVEKPILVYTEYGPEMDPIVREMNLDNISADPAPVQWYDLRGLHDTKWLDKLGHHFQIHPLILEDALDVDQRPKFEEYQNSFFFTFHEFRYRPESGTLDSEQLSIYCVGNVVLSFQEDNEDAFEGVRKRIEDKLGRIRHRGGDYLAYALIDVVVDHYFDTLESLTEQVNNIEDRIFKDPRPEIKSEIHLVKRQLIHFRKYLLPLREAINRFSRTEISFIDKKTHYYVRDLYDHCIQAVDGLEHLRETVLSLQDLYNSELSFRMNSVMQTLTIITTIFIPLSFLAGIYGMNFRHMPELDERYAYHILLGVMATIAISLLIVFRRKGWL
jgi:magnesium transporter